MLTSGVLVFPEASSASVPGEQSEWLQWGGGEDKSVTEKFLCPYFSQITCFSFQENLQIWQMLYETVGKQTVMALGIWKQVMWLIFQRSCVLWWSPRPFQQTQACLNVSPTTPLAQCPAQPCWKFTTVRGLFNQLWVNLLNCDTQWKHLLCRPGGAAGDGSRSPAGSSFSQSGERGSVTSGDVVVQKEHRGVFTCPVWFDKPPPSWVAWQPPRRQLPCWRVSRRTHSSQSVI